MPTHIITTSLAIVAIATIEIVAVLNGLDGVLLSGALAAIAGLAGFMIPSPFQRP